MRDGEATRSRVLEKAAKVFSRNGYHGTSLGKLAKESGVSDALILHHFKTKENLYKETLEYVAASYKTSMKLQGKIPVSFKSALRESVGDSYRFWNEDSLYYRLSLWSYLEGHLSLNETESELTRDMVSRVRLLQSVGYFEKDFYPIVYLSMIVGTIHYWQRYKKQFRELLHSEESEEELEKKFLDQLTELLFRAGKKTRKKRGDENE